MNSNKKDTAAFVKYHPGLSLLFSPAETIFILQMVNYEYLKSVGYKICWTKAEYVKRTGMKEYTFDACVKHLTEMKLLKRTYNRMGNRVFYSFNPDLYNKLVRIVSQTADVDKLAAFCETNFKKQSRSIESITEEEMDKLKYQS